MAGQARAGQPGLHDLVELSARLRADEGRPRAALHRRDRAMGRDLASFRGRPARQLVAWLDRTRDPQDVLARRVAAALRVVAVALAVLGFLVGWGVAAALFYYDGSTPVNVVNVLAVFVGLQLLLLVPLLFMLLPASVPGVTAVQETIALLSPGRLWRLAAPLLPTDTREHLDGLLGVGQAHGRVYGNVQKWGLLRWSQLFALAFNVGAVLRFVQLIVFTDVAFAWSTTLRIEDEFVYGVTQALAAPWAWAWPDAAPTLALVKDTRFFRPQTLETPREFGGWWPFVLMCMLTYGLLPRVITLSLAWWRLRRAVAWAMVHTPGAALVLDRLNAEPVETRAIEPEVSGETEKAVEPQAAVGVPGRVRAVLNWSAAPVSDEALRTMLGAEAAPVLHVGGTRTLEEDQRTLVELPQGDSTAAVAVVVKSWEPPVLELLDFLADLRRVLGPGVPITVMPISIDESKQVAPPDASHLAQWERKVRGSGDPWTMVATLATTAAG